MEPMTHDTERLSEYLDGGLAPAERAALEAHLAACSECSALLGELREVLERSRALEDRPPEVDLWPGIAARLRPRREGWWSRLAATLRGEERRLSLSLPQLAAIGAALVIVAAGGTWLAMTRAPLRHAPPAVSSAPGLPSTGTVASFDEARYDATVAELQRVIREHGSELDTSTVRILQQNLATIDRAVDQARRALLADPGNPYLHGHLAEQMTRKVWLLQRAAEVVTAQS